MNYAGTRQVARMLDVGLSRLARAVWDGRLDAPAKAPDGAFLWTTADIERASWLLRGRDAGDVLSEQPGVENV